MGNNFGRLPRWAAAFWFLTWNAACGGSERGFDESSKWSVDPVGFASQDSAGIAILVTTGDLTSRRLGWNVSSEPNLVLGDGPDPGEQFFRIRGAAPLATPAPVEDTIIFRTATTLYTFRESGRSR